MTTIHVRYEVLDEAGKPDPDCHPDAYAWGVRALGLPGNVSVYGAGDTLEAALADLTEGIRLAFAGQPIPEELTREIAVTIEDAA